MKFIHISNVRFGDAPDQEAFPALDRTAEYENDLMKVIASCNEQKADALFITGNLFSHKPSEEDLKKADDVFMKLETARVFWLTGKADTMSPEEAGYSFKSRTTLFTGDSIQRVYLPACRTEITAIGYQKSTWDKVRLGELKRGRKGAIQILLMPFIGDENTSDGLNDLDLPFDYTGIGQKVLYKGAKLLSPGLFEPEGFSQQIGHGCFVCTLNTGSGKTVSLTRQFIPCAGREYISVRANLTRDLKYEDVEDQLKKTIRTYGSDNIYEIVLEGEISPSVFAGKNRLDEIGLVKKLDDRTDSKEMLKEIRTEHSEDALGLFLNELFTDDEPDRFHTLAFEYGLNALNKAEAEA